MSNETARLIDSEVRRIIEEAEGRARAALNEHMDALHAVAKALLTYETLSGEEVQSILGGEEISRDHGVDDEHPKGRTAIPLSSRGARRSGRAIGPPQIQPQS